MGFDSVLPKVCFCALRFIVQRGKVLLHLKEICPHLNNILSASCTSPRKQSSESCNTPGIGRGMTHHLLGTFLFWSQLLLPSPTSHPGSLSHTSPGLPGAPHTDKRPLCMAQGVISVVRTHRNRWDLCKWRADRYWDPVPPGQFLPWSWTQKWLLCLS